MSSWNGDQHCSTQKFVFLLAKNAIVVLYNASKTFVLTTNNFCFVNDSAIQLKL